MAIKNRGRATDKITGRRVAFDPTSLPAVSKVRNLELIDTYIWKAAESVTDLVKYLNGQRKLETLSKFSKQT